MVSKSYVVSKFTKTLRKKEAKRECDEEKCCDMQCCDHNSQIMSEKKKSKNSNLFVIQMSEMAVSSSCFSALIYIFRSDVITQKKSAWETLETHTRVITIKACIKKWRKKKKESVWRSWRQAEWWFIHRQGHS